MTTVDLAFKRARTEAWRHMQACERAHLRWAEPAITEMVMAYAAQAVTVVPFTQPAESVSGADWVWWWVDGTSAYGMLVQAKRLTITDDAWSFDFGYRVGHSSKLQRELLMRSASELGLVPVYALYLGTGAYRDWEPCSEAHAGRRCVSCVKRTVSVMPALLANEWAVTSATETYARSVALEEVYRPSHIDPWLFRGLVTQLAPELGDFLRTRQDGTRAVAKSMIAKVLTVRAGQFSAPTMNPVHVRNGKHDRLGPVFGELPDDTGHFGVPYFEHVLGPLHQAPPEYVLEIESGSIDAANLESDVPEGIAGIVVTRLPR